jgi:peptide/nickel transport system substrate-binding protein
LLTLALPAVSCGANNKANTSNTPINGQTVTYALPAGITPNYIFPFAPSTVFTAANVDNLSYFLYRPLYWFGGQDLPYLNEKLSLAEPPQYKGQVVTIRLKPGLHWSNGTNITAKDVMFWMNMMRAEAHVNWGGYVPGGLPDNVRDIHKVGTDAVRMTITTKYSPLWFTDNELSQITPMPQAWDVRGRHTRSDCTDHYRECTAVFDYLYGLSRNTATWATSPLWGVVDGPWKLTGYNSQGVLTFTFNRSYSLRVPKHHIAVFSEIPFTSEQAEFNQLQAGGSNQLDVGYLPTVDAPVPPFGATVGQNPVSGYFLQPVYAWGLSYIPYNFNPADPQAAILEQQYFRHAFQLLVNQAGIIQGALHAYGVVTTGPVGNTPATRYLTKAASRGDPFPYNQHEAINLLTKHGWQVNPGGVTKCINPGKGSGQCGPGVQVGAKLSFKMLYATGNAWVQAAVLQLKSNAAYVGIQITLTGEPFDEIIRTVGNGCGPKPTIPKPCPWQIADWGQAWSYVPDYLPTGDELFETGSLGNVGQYSNGHNDALISATLQTHSTSALFNAMYNWEKWLTPQLPVIYQPSAPAYLMESVNSLCIGTQSPTLALTPEDWYYVNGRCPSSR